MQTPDQPKGELVIRTIAMPADTNPNGDIFGGWIMSQMDLGSGILAAKTAQTRVVTVAMEGMSFLEALKPDVHVDGSGELAADRSTHGTLRNSVANVRAE